MRSARWHFEAVSFDQMVQSRAARYGKKVILWLFWLKLRYAIWQFLFSMKKKNLLKSWLCDICYDLSGFCTKQMFAYIWRTRFLGQGVSAASQNFTIICFLPYFFLFQKTAIWLWFCDLDIAHGHIAISIILQLIVQP